MTSSAAASCSSKLFSDLATRASSFFWAEAAASRSFARVSSVAFKSMTTLFFAAPILIISDLVLSSLISNCSTFRSLSSSTFLSLSLASSRLLLRLLRSRAVVCWRLSVISSLSLTSEKDSCNAAICALSSFSTWRSSSSSFSILSLSSSALRSISAVNSSCLFIWSCNCCSSSPSRPPKKSRMPRSQSSPSLARRAVRLHGRCRRAAIAAPPSNAKLAKPAPATTPRAEGAPLCGDAAISAAETDAGAASDKEGAAAVTRCSPGSGGVVGPKEKPSPSASMRAKVHTVQAAMAPGTNLCRRRRHRRFAAIEARSHTQVAGGE
mmetsp:Transcript_127430/g.271686  ORF Transcript_127430/g.271686 Transcript_127430/m.271686 type:complete len:323 (+) Transcript_127430:984-1952(+)